MREKEWIAYHKLDVHFVGLVSQKLCTQCKPYILMPQPDQTVPLPKG